MKRIITLLFTILLTSTTAWAQDTWNDHTEDFTQLPLNAGRDGSVTNPFLLQKAEHLAFVAREVNQGNTTYRFAYYQLEDDIDLDGYLWIPIGTDQYPFSGSLNGKEKSILNLTIANREEWQRINGLFGKIVVSAGETIEIKDLVLESGSIVGNDGEGYAGTLIGQLENIGGVVVIENCHNTGVSITGGSYESGAFYLGGLIGSITSISKDMPAIITIDYCSNEASVTGAGISSGNADLCTGGLIGFIENSAQANSGISNAMTIMSCLNKGEIRSGQGANLGTYCGGLVGEVVARSNTNSIGTSKFDIIYCINEGDIYGGDSHTPYAGGLIGHLFLTGEKGAVEVSVDITRNINTGEIYGADGMYQTYAGGIVGHIGGSWAFNSTTQARLYITGCINSNAIHSGQSASFQYTGGIAGGIFTNCTDMRITACMNEGDINGGNKGDSSTGGLAGFTSVSESYAHTQIKECYSTCTVNASGGYAGGLIGYTFASSNGILDLSGCYAAGKVTGSADYAGGLIGGVAYRKSGMDKYPVLSNALAVMSVLEGETKNRIGTYFRYILMEGNIEEEDFADGILTEMYSWHPTLPSGTTTDKMGAEWETGTFQEEPFLTLLTDSEWDLDPENKRMPILLSLSGNHKEFPNPWQEKTTPPTPPIPSIYHTVTLELGAGIQANYRAGDLTVGEGEYLYLQFGADDPAVTAADVLFVIDGEETAFKNPGAGYNFTYLLNDIYTDRKIVIALRDYPVTLPSVDGAVTDPAAGTHTAAYGKPFSFTLTPRNEQVPGDIRVYANGEILTPDNDADLYRYTIHKITGPVVITIEGVDPTGNIPIGNAEMNITMDNGQLTIDNYGNPVTCTIYTLTGQLYATRPLPEGTTTVDLPQGVYIVRAGQTTVKVISH